MARQPGPGSRVREESTAYSFTLPPGMRPEGPCRHVMDSRGRLCRKAGKAMLDAAETMRTGRPVHGHRCPGHAFRP